MIILKAKRSPLLILVIITIFISPHIAFTKGENIDVITEIKKGNYYIITEGDKEDKDFLRIKKEFRTPEVAEALYQLLLNPPKSFFGGESESYIEFISILGDTNDPRVIPYLIKYCGGNLAVERSLALMGEPALNTIFDIIKDNEKKSGGIGRGFIRTLVHMLEIKEDGYIAKGGAREKIRKVLIKATNDKDSVTRMRAVVGLGELAIQGDSDVIPIIKKLAKEDPYSQRFTKRYYVREEAQKVLEKLKKEGKIKEK